MALCCCLGPRATVKEFTFLLIHVLHVSHPAALEGTTRYAREIVDRFFSEHTQIDVSYIEPLLCHRGRGQVSRRSWFHYSITQLFHSSNETELTEINIF